MKQQVQQETTRSIIVIGVLMKKLEDTHDTNPELYQYAMNMISDYLERNNRQEVGYEHVSILIEDKLKELVSLEDPDDDHEDSTNKPNQQTMMNPGATMPSHTVASMMMDASPTKSHCNDKTYRRQFDDSPMIMMDVRSPLPAAVPSYYYSDHHGTTTSTIAATKEPPRMNLKRKSFPLPTRSTFDSHHHSPSMEQSVHATMTPSTKRPVTTSIDKPHHSTDEPQLKKPKIEHHHDDDQEDKEPAPKLVVELDENNENQEYDDDDDDDTTGSIVQTLENTNSNNISNSSSSDDDDGDGEDNDDDDDEEATIVL
jgi:hypothetical protein